MTNAVKFFIVAATVVCGLRTVCLTANAEEPAARLHAFPMTLPDATIVVFKKGNSIGVARITNQSLPPSEGCDVEWFLRDDGRLDFSPSAPGLTTGTIKGTRQIKFGPFDSEWSVNTVGRGFVYLTDDYFTGVVVQPDLKNLERDLNGTTMIKKLDGEFLTLIAKKEG